MRTEQGYQECSIVRFMERCLQEHILDVYLPGFKITRTDRDCRQSGNSKGGGSAALIKNRWFNHRHVTRKKHLCTPEVELLAVSLHLCCLFAAVVVCDVVKSLPRCKRNNPTHSLQPLEISPFAALQTFCQLISNITIFSFFLLNKCELVKKQRTWISVQHNRQDSAF